ncbi:MAG: NADH:ubiquinone oxidoreductase [Nitrososphaeria archaeon]|nr:NADH:ubiquinone oxidoreductase [Nitrososphaeria archaeon]
MDKIRVGIFNLSSCEGCLVQILNLEDILLNILKTFEVECRVLGTIGKSEPYDIAFVEGSVMSIEDEMELKKIRGASRILVALGECACHGGNFLVKDFDVDEINEMFPGSQKWYSHPIERYVRVDYRIPGCPIDKEEFFTVFKSLLLEKFPEQASFTVCSECILKENSCLIEKGVACMGPITRGGCKAICPTFNRECYGCRGLNDDANIDGLLHTFKEKGISIQPYMLPSKKGEVKRS